jgi:hypothetical protein
MFNYIAIDFDLTRLKYAKYIAKQTLGSVIDGKIVFSSYEDLVSAQKLIHQERLYGFSCRAGHFSLSLNELTCEIKVFYRHFCYEMAKNGCLVITVIQSKQRDVMLELMHNCAKEALDRICNDNNFVK